jgi:hypothetical protein
MIFRFFGRRFVSMAMRLFIAIVVVGVSCTQADTVDPTILLQNWRIPETNEPATGWEWIETGFTYILVDIGFPEGQSQIGCTIGESLTYKGEGLVLKSVDGGNTWVRLAEPAGRLITKATGRKLSTRYDSLRMTQVSSAAQGESYCAMHGRS